MARKKVRKRRKLIRAHNKNLSETAMYSFLNMISYKAAWYGVKKVIVEQYQPSTILCSECGYKLPHSLPTNIRNWTCPKCKVKHDRDVNAAINLRKYAEQSVLNNHE